MRRTRAVSASVSLTPDFDAGAISALQSVTAGSANVQQDFTFTVNVDAPAGVSRDEADRVGQQIAASAYRELRAKVRNEVYTA